MRANISIASFLALMASLAQATWLTMVGGGGCMNVAPENLNGWKGDLDPYDESNFNNGSRVSYTSVCSAWGYDSDSPHTPIILDFNNPINTGDRGQATISTVWQKVYPAPPWACSFYSDCPYTAPGCTANFTWDAKIGQLYVRNYTSPSGVEDPNTVCLWYNETTIVIDNEQIQCCQYDSTAPVLPLQVNPYYSVAAVQAGRGYPWNAPWPSVPWWWLTPFASSD